MVQYIEKSDPGLSLPVVASDTNIAWQPRQELPHWTMPDTTEIVRRVAVDSDGLDIADLQELAQHGDAAAERLAKYVGAQVLPHSYALAEAPQDPYGPLPSPLVPAGYAVVSAIQVPKYGVHSLRGFKSTEVAYKIEDFQRTESQLGLEAVLVRPLPDNFGVTVDGTLVMRNFELVLGQTKHTGKNS